MDTSKLMADLIETKTEVGVLKAAAATHDAALVAANTARDEAVTARDEAQAEVTRLTGELETARKDNKLAEADAAVTWLTASLTKLLTAANKPVENLPTDVAGLTAAIDAETKGLTAIIPAGGKSEGAGSATEEKPKASLSAFQTKK